MQKLKLKTLSVRVDNFICGGSLVIRSKENGRITNAQLEAVRRVIVKKTNKKVKVVISIVPKKTVTKKPIGIRMGKGKGAIVNTVFDVKKGNFLFEIIGSVTTELKNILKKASLKLPVQTTLTTRVY